MNRGISILLKKLLVDENGILKIVTTPRHEGDGDILTKGKFTTFRARAVSKELALNYLFTRENHRGLGKAGRLVRLLIFVETIDTDAGIKTACSWLLITNDNTVGVNLFNNTVTVCKQANTRIASHCSFHTGTHQR